MYYCFALLLALSKEIGTLLDVITPGLPQYNGNDSVYISNTV